MVDTGDRADSGAPHNRDGARGDIVVTFGHDELIIRRRYEFLSIANDVLIALWFVAGSILFFFESLNTLATWFFLLGSIEFLVRPAIRLTRAVHLRRIRSDGAVDSTPDF
ncbi:MAG TPA: YrhK family protein [Amycolatopsis sp.]|nr:YrhK family protein [Amycolatopsis sp.]